MKLGLDFYQKGDVVTVARELIGKVLYTRVDRLTTAGIIVETEAYSWREKGCHAYGQKKTGRNAVMFKNGGHAYVYLCYGMHHLFNIVTGSEGIPEAVLIRALEPLEGIDTMIKRRGNAVDFKHLTSGPGKLTKSMGIDRSWNGKILINGEIWVEDHRLASENGMPENKIAVSRRIGIDYAGEDAELPWRFSVKGNSWVSKIN